VHQTISLSTGNPASIRVTFEHRYQRPLSFNAFVGRMLLHGGYAGAIVTVSVIVGSAGYHAFGGESWIDSVLDACMLLGGMGQVGVVQRGAGKLFAALFALYAGLVFIAVTALILAPVFHRVLHHFHWDGDKAGAHRPRDPLL
jgi:uncharacterized protein CbrC (UPF0167 family)